jgi:hypothetical protein
MIPTLRRNNRQLCAVIASILFVSTGVRLEGLVPSMDLK